MNQEEGARLVEILENKDAVEDIRKALEMHPSALDGRIEVNGMNGSLLHWACNYGCTNVAKLLLNSRADLDLKFEGKDGGITALDLVKKNKHEELIDVLSFFTDQIKMEKEQMKNNIDITKEYNNTKNEGLLQFIPSRSSAYDHDDLDTEEENSPSAPKGMLQKSTSVGPRRLRDAKGAGSMFKLSHPQMIRGAIKKAHSTLIVSRQSKTPSPRSSRTTSPRDSIVLGSASSPDVPNALEVMDEFSKLKSLQDSVALCLEHIVGALQNHLISEKQMVENLPDAEAVMIAVAELKQIKDVMRGHMSVDVLNLLPNYQDPPKTVPDIDVTTN